MTIFKTLPKLSRIYINFYSIHFLHLLVKGIIPWHLELQIVLFFKYMHIFGVLLMAFAF